MAGVNKVIVLGNLGRKPELKFTPSQTAVCTFSVAVSESWNDKQSGQKQERTEWVNVVVYGKQAENCDKYLDKGSKVYLEGKMQTRDWEDKNGGSKRYKTEVVAHSVQFLDPVGSKPQEEAQSKQPQFTADDIPF